MCMKLEYCNILVLEWPVLSVFTICWDTHICSEVTMCVCVCVCVCVYTHARARARTHTHRERERERERGPDVSELTFFLKNRRRMRKTHSFYFKFKLSPMGIYTGSCAVVQLLKSCRKFLFFWRGGDLL